MKSTPTHIAEESTSRPARRVWSFLLILIPLMPMLGHAQVREVTVPDLVHKGGIPFTPVAPTSSMAKHEGLVPVADGPGDLFRCRGGLPRVIWQLFYRLLEQTATVRPVPYAAMVRGVRGRPRRCQHNRWYVLE